MFKKQEEMEARKIKRREQKKQVKYKNSTETKQVSSTLLGKKIIDKEKQPFTRKEFVSKLIEP
jgi:hypothetical protein